VRGRRLALGLLLVGLLLPPPAAAATFHPWRHCRFKVLGGPAWSVENVRDTARCAARKNGLYVPKFLAVVSCESGFNPYPSNPRYVGPMQYLPSTFASHYAAFPHYTRWHRLIGEVQRPRANVMVAARFIRSYGYSPWSCA